MSAAVDSGTGTDATLRLALPREPLRIRLTLDDGLAPYLRALVACPYGIFGDERETIIYLVRSGLIELFKSPAYRAAMMPYLPEDIQRAWKANRAAELAFPDGGRG